MWNGSFREVNLISLLLASLATWRVSYMLVNEAGPWNVFVKLRELMGIEHDEWGTPVVWPSNTVLGCFWCTSVWVAVIFLVLPNVIDMVFAISALAIWFNTKAIEGK